MSKKKNKTPDIQRSYLDIRGYPRNNFGRMFRSMYESERYRNLSPSTKDIFMGMILACNTGSNIRFLFPKSAYEKLTTKATFHKAKRELIENGFITEKSCRTRPSIYTLSNKWMLEEIPKSETRIIDNEEYDREIKVVKKKTS